MIHDPDRTNNPKYSRFAFAPIFFYIYTFWIYHLLIVYFVQLSNQEYFCVSCLCFSIKNQLSDYGLEVIITIIYRIDKYSFYLWTSI